MSTIIHNNSHISYKVITNIPRRWTMKWIARKLRTPIQWCYIFFHNLSLGGVWWPTSQWRPPWSYLVVWLIIVNTKEGAKHDSKTATQKREHDQQANQTDELGSHGSKCFKRLPIDDDESNQQTKDSLERQIRCNEEGLRLHESATIYT